MPSQKPETTSFTDEENSSNSPMGIRERVRMDSDWRFHYGELKGSIHTISVTGWRWKSAGKEKPTDERITSPQIKADGPEWQDVIFGQDVFNLLPGFAWFKAELPDCPGPHRFLHFDSVDDNATVYLNGKKIFYHEGWNDCFDVPLDSAWNEGGPNQVTLLVENIFGGIFLGGFIREVDICSVTHHEPAAIAPDFDNSSWESVHLPHDFVVGETFDPRAEVYHGFLPRKTGWYRKTFEIPVADKGKNLWIDFDGIYRNSTFWLNGRPLGTHLSGYTGIHFDITDLVHYGDKNILTIHVDARSGEGWWYEGGGIYRHVWLNKSDYLRVAPCGTFVVSTIPNEETAPVEAEIEIRTKVLNGFQNALSFNILSEIQDSQGKTVLRFFDSHTVGIDAVTEVIQKVKLSRPLLWSLENPHLYRLITQLEREGELVDGVVTPFGIRSIRFDENKGFFLNNRPVQIKGTCNHQDFAGIGVALPDRIVTYRLEKLIEMGSNAYRCSHNPPSIELLNECDRLGLLVIDEHRKMGESEEILTQVESMVLRDRNHPSIILWSLCNEEPKQGTEDARRMGDKMKQVVLKHDQTRLVTCAMNFGWGAGLTQVIDTQGFNYNISQYDVFHASHPRMPIYGSETASAVSTRGVYENNPEKGYLSAYDVNHPEWGNTAETAWKALVERPFISGGFVWTGFDYRGEPTPFKWPCINSHFGIMDVCGFPKDTYYYYQSWWTDKTVLHLFPHWNWQGKEDQAIDVWCHSNCESVELFLNEKSLGSQKMPRNGHLEWKVKYHPGTLKAVGIRSGKVIEVMVETASAPVKVHLKPYQLEMIADGEDMIPVEVEILDWKNRLVPLADNEVVFTVSGPGKIAGVGNGDPSSHEPDKADRRKTFNGRCMVLVQTLEKSGEIKLTAKSQGLRHATIILKSIEERK